MISSPSYVHELANSTFECRGAANCLRIGCVLFVCAFIGASCLSQSALIALKSMKTPKGGGRLTPMLAQYLEIKKQHPDSILFFRLGDFYEMFFEDATKAAPLLEVQLTTRDKKSDNPIPLCGIPYHAATTYIKKLIKHGLKVAICEQTEDPSQAKGIVKRAVTRVVTPALIGDPDLVAPETANRLMALFEDSSGKIEIGTLDLLSGEIRFGKVDSFRRLLDWTQQLRPKELLVPNTERRWFQDLREFLPSVTVTIREHYFDKSAKHSPVLEAIGQYTKETQKIDKLPYLSEPKPLGAQNKLLMDPTTLRALEILEGSSDQVDSSLFQNYNRTLTPMGRRKLKEWLSEPLADKKAIEKRHEAVENFLTDTPLSSDLSRLLGEMRDLERLSTKTTLGLALPRDLVGIREALNKIPEIRERLQRASGALRQVGEKLSPLTPLTDHLERALLDEPPIGYREGGIFKTSYSEKILELRNLAHHAKETILAMETREREQTGISNLKIKYSRVFGYTIEVSKSHLSKVPSSYFRKQTIANGERYVTEELKRFEEKVITAETKLKKLEEELFLKIRSQVSASIRDLLSNATLIAELDVLLAFSKVARDSNHSRPQMHDQWDLFIESGRHPIVEAHLPRGSFVPNDLNFSSDCRTIVLTGPNMAGKSTIIRQVALICLIAQAGGFVPAKKARLPVLDAIFTRIGSSDDLAGGRSTFMVEMTEMAGILDRASDKSLILIDEIGRGTSTYDGLSLAWSLLEYLHHEIQAKVLFATHFHEVTALESSLPGLKNFNVLVEKRKDQMLFLHQLAPGTCHQSFGIDVAKLAHLPSKVLSRAKKILGVLESQSQQGYRKRRDALKAGTDQMNFFE